MSNQQIKSEAFRQAALKSESYRIIGLIVLLIALVAYVVARGYALGMWRLMAAETLLLVLALACEAIVLAVVKHAVSENRDVPDWIWLFNLLVETQLATLALFVLIRNQTLDP